MRRLVWITLAVTVPALAGLLLLLQPDSSPAQPKAGRAQSPLRPEAGGSSAAPG